MKVEDFKQRLLYLLWERNLTQSQLAAQTEIPKTTISGWLNTNRAPDFYSLTKLADFFGISMDDLCGRTVSSRKPEKSDTTNLTPKETALIKDIRALPGSIDYVRGVLNELARQEAEFKKKHGS